MQTKKEQQRDARQRAMLDAAVTALGDFSLELEPEAQVSRIIDAFIAAQKCGPDEVYGEDRGKALRKIWPRASA